MEGPFNVSSIIGLLGSYIQNQDVLFPDLLQGERGKIHAQSQRRSPFHIIDLHLIKIGRSYAKGAETPDEVFPGRILELLVISSLIAQGGIGTVFHTLTA